MRRFLPWLGLLLLIGAGLAALAWFKRDVVLKPIAVRVLQQSTGMRAEIGECQSAPASGALSMRSVRLYNYPEFGPGVLLDMPELTVELDREMAAAGQIRFKQLRVTVAELNVIQDSAGRWNFEKLEREMSERNAARTNRTQHRLAFAGIDDLKLTLGRIRYTDLKRPDRSREIMAGVTNESVTGIRTEEQLQEWIGNFLFRVILQEVNSPDSELRRKPKAREALKNALDR